ncbi:MAG: SURF1 family protein, partial [Paracoccaceae bacterium]
MLRRIVVPLIFGLGGCAILLALGFWQLRRLDWKEGQLAEIESRIHAEPVALAALDLTAAPDKLRYTPVTLTGRTTGKELLVLTSQRNSGPGFRVIAAFATDDGRNLMIDRGYIPEAARADARPPVAMIVTGNLHWPVEVDSYTPPPDLEKGLWYARDVPAMADALGAEPLLVVAREVSPDAQGVQPLPIDTAHIANDHLEYAIT